MLNLTSDTPSSVRREAARDINADFITRDVVICSPAMTAGSSFTVPGHFTRMVAVAENMGHEGPTVDATPQQWWRVRSLGEAGMMYIYVIDPQRCRLKAGPTDTNGLDGYIQVCVVAVCMVWAGLP